MDTVAIKKTGLGILIGVLLMIGVQSVSAWTAPSNPPVGGNVVAPVNTGSFLQLKPGTLGLHTLIASGPGNIGHVEAEQGFFGLISNIPQANSNLFQVTNTANLSKALIFNANGDLIFHDGTPDAAGRVLTSDASGKATWQSGGLPAGIQGHTLRYDGTKWADTPLLRNDGNNLVQVSSQTGPLMPSSIFTVPTMLVGGDVIAMNAQSIPPQPYWQYTYSSSGSGSQTLQGSSGTLPTVGTFASVMGISSSSLQSRRITGPCNDITLYPGSPSPQTSYSANPECTASSYAISDPSADPDTYVYELYSSRVYSGVVNGSDQYATTLYWRRYNKEQITPPQSPAGGGNVKAVHAKISDLSGPDKPVCADADGDLISCDFPEPPAPVAPSIQKESFVWASGIRNPDGTATCSTPGAVAVGGGVKCSAGAAISASEPFSSSWYGRCAGPVGSNVQIDVYVVCMDFTP